jgi:formylglycine-generating enzyme required for sulfatase activity
MGPYLAARIPVALVLLSVSACRAGQLADGIERWRLTNFGTSAAAEAASDAADPDGDGLPNLFEYATGSSPTVPNASPATLSTSSNYLEVSVPKSGSGGVTWVAQSSDDLLSWSTTNVSVLRDDAGVFSARENSPVANTAKRFLRLKTSRLPRPIAGAAADVSLGRRNVAEKLQIARCSLGWSNSWRNEINHDALWIFVKFRTGDGLWRHATLSTNASKHGTGSAGASAAITPAPDGKGVFFHRSTSGIGSGPFSSTNFEIAWNYAADGVQDTEDAVVMVYAFEMVYVPQGAFYAGDGTDGTGDPGNIFQGQLRRAESNNPFLVSSESALTLGGTSAGNMTSAGGSTPPDDFNGVTTRSLPAAYPKGFSAFYCMKHEITQAQYADFLNSLTYDQQAGVTRQLTATPQYASVSPSAPVGTKVIITTQGNSNFRNYVEIAVPGAASASPAVYGVDADEDNIYNEATDGIDLACGYLTWLDGCAFADWAGLRPMSQLEFEKACRGPVQPVPNEFAWGNNTRIAAAGLLNAGTFDEVASNTEANVCASNLIQGPVRTGMFFAPEKTRAQSGSSYYGILDMSGNVWERVAALGRPEGRNFVPNHGDGSISTDGYANVPGWTGNVGGTVTSGLGTGFVGGNFFRTEDFNGNYFNYALLRVSGRLYGNTTDSVRFSGNGFRCVRSD